MTARPAAVEDLGRVVERRPDDGDARFLHALALERTGRTADAVRELDALLAREPDHAAARGMRRRIGSGGL